MPQFFADKLFPFSPTSNFGAKWRAAATEEEDDEEEELPPRRAFAYLFCCVSHFRLAAHFYCTPKVDASSNVKLLKNLLLAKVRAGCANVQSEGRGRGGGVNNKHAVECRRQISRRPSRNTLTTIWRNFAMENILKYMEIENIQYFHYWNVSALCK